MVLLGGAPTARKAQVVDISNSDHPTGRVCPDLADLPSYILGVAKGGYINGHIMIGDRSDCTIYHPENNTWSMILVNGVCIFLGRVAVSLGESSPTAHGRIYSRVLLQNTRVYFLF